MSQGIETEPQSGRSVVAIEAPAAGGNRAVRPYAASWLNRLFARVDRLPLPSWTFYLAAWLVLFVAYSAMKWRDGAYAPGTFFLFHVVYTALVPYVLAAAHHINGVARSTMHSFKSVFAGDDADFSRLSYELTTTPARLALLATAAGMIVGAMISLVLGHEIRAAQRLFTSPLSSLVDSAIIMASWAVLVTVIFQSVRELRVVSHIYARHTRIDLFTPGPLYAFSAFTARSALSTLFALYAWFAVDPSPRLSNVPFIAALTIFGLAAVLALGQPLLGLHELLAAEKRRLQDENGRQMKAALAELHRRVDAREMKEAGELEAVVNSLVAERDVLAKLRTWPWDLDTARLVLTATLLPILVWIMQRVLERLGL